jgi:opacity protein-like surface antigen
VLGYGVIGKLTSQRVPTNFDSSNDYLADNSFSVSPLLSIGGGYISHLSPRLALHSGLSLHYLAPFNETGAITADGVSSNSLYTYTVNSMALMADASLVYQLNNPHLDNVYARLSVGMSQNRASGYHRINGAGDASPSMAFANHTETGFAYGLGIGMQFKLSAHWRVGPEYQYWNLGTVSLGQGKNIEGNARGPLKGGSLNTQGLAIVHATYRF